MKFEEYIETIISDFQKGLIQTIFAQNRYMKLMLKICSKGQDGLLPFINNFDLIAEWNIHFSSYPLDFSKSLYEQLMDARIRKLTEHEILFLEKILDLNMKLPLKFSGETVEKLIHKLSIDIAEDYFEASKILILNGFPLIDVSNAEVELQCSEKLCTQLTINKKSEVGITKLCVGETVNIRVENDSDDISLPLIIRLNLLSNRKNYRLNRREENTEQK